MPFDKIPKAHSMQKKYILEFVVFDHERPDIA